LHGRAILRGARDRTAHPHPPLPYSQEVRSPEPGRHAQDTPSHASCTAYITVLHNGDVAPLSKTHRLELLPPKTHALRCATRKHFKMVPAACCSGAARAGQYNPDTGRATVQEHDTRAVSPSSRRYRSSPITRTSPHTVPLSHRFDKRKKQRKTGNAPSKHAHHRPHLPLLPHVVLGPQLLGLPRFCSFSPSILLYPFPPIRARAYPSSAPSVRLSAIPIPIPSS
jgi:hypothetical protein